MILNIDEDINENFENFLKSKKRECIIYGGAGAGKSYASAQKVLIYNLLFPESKTLIMRKTYPALKLTSLELIEKLLNKYMIKYEINRSELILKLGNGSRMIFKSLDNPEKIKSISDVNLIWFEEPTEISEKDYDIVNLRLRGEELKKGFRQIILSFNPIDRNHWLFKRFFEKEVDIYKGKFTYKDNKFLDSEYKKVLEDLKEKDEYLYNVYCLGEWGTLKGQIYTKWDTFKEDKEYEDIIAGIDFGFNNPNAFLLIGIKDDEIFVFDEIYRTQLTTPELIDLIKEKLKMWNVNPDIYCEHEPDRNKAFMQAGLKVFEAKKDVLVGINFLKTKKLHIHERCINTIKEIQGYKYKEDRNGNVLEEPVKFNDHTMDALRYAVFTYYGKPKVRVFQKPFGL